MTANVDVEAAPALGPEDVAFADGELTLPCSDGVERRYVNLDLAATTPALKAVVEGVTAFLPWYGSVGRSSGRPGEISLAAQHDRGDQPRRRGARPRRGRPDVARRAPREPPALEADAR